VSSDAIAVEIGHRVAALRRDTGMSKKAIAEAADMDSTHYSRIENGTGNPTAQLLVQLAVAFDVDPSQFLEGLGIETLEDVRRPYPYWRHPRYPHRPDLN
jgi:transcriptional regulator with XRE-family HTH domain